MRLQAQRGMSLVIALFVVVVVAALAAAAVTFATTRRQSMGMELAAERALEAARAGIEWGGYRALVNNACAASTVLNLTQGALRGYAVTVRCTVTPHTDGALNLRIYDLTAFAQHGRFGANEYASRTVTGRFSSAP
jgi:MSHA biogenesis protein MshP